MKVDVYNTEGKKAGTADIADAVFATDFNADLVHQVVVGMQANAREGVGRAHVKDRSDVRGGGKKPWRQKGTGRARHGSSRSPIWVGGGVTHGPLKEKKYGKKINKKMRVKALYSTLSQKVTDGEMFFVDTLSFDEPKTRKAKAVITALASVKELASLVEKKHNVALIVIPDATEALKKSFGNIGNVTVVEARNVNPVDVLSYKYVILISPEASSDVLVARMEGKRSGAKVEKKKSVVKTEKAETQKKTSKKTVKKKTAPKKKTVARKVAKKTPTKKTKK